MSNEARPHTRRRAAGVVKAERMEALRRLRSLRKEAADEIDRLLGFLDASDIDPDLEETGDDEEGADAESSLGAFDRMVDQSKAWTQKHGELCFSVDAEQDDADNEPSLAGLGDHHLNQERWSDGSRQDLEQDPAESGDISVYKNSPFFPALERARKFMLHLGEIGFPRCSASSTGTSASCCRYWACFGRPAPVVRDTGEGSEIGTPPPPRTGGPLVTSIRNTSSPP
jgi:hypothetical protein